MRIPEGIKKGFKMPEGAFWYGLLWLILIAMQILILSASLSR